MHQYLTKTLNHFYLSFMYTLFLIRVKWSIDSVKLGRRKYQFNVFNFDRKNTTCSIGHHERGTRTGEL